jgi:hypothetical protein
MDLLGKLSDCYGIAAIVARASAKYLKIAVEKGDFAAEIGGFSGTLVQSVTILQFKECDGLP